MSSETRIPRAFRSATEHAPFAATTPGDPLRLCINTTVAAIAWLVTPALAVTLFGAIAIRAYVRARRAGLLASKCKLGDTRLVLAYLVVLTTAGAGWTAFRLWQVASGS